jgi:hypothetical protein
MIKEITLSLNIQGQREDTLLWMCEIGVTADSQLSICRWFMYISIHTLCFGSVLLYTTNIPV